MENKRGRPRESDEDMIRRQFELPESLNNKLEEARLITPGSKRKRPAVDVVREALEEKLLRPKPSGEEQLQSAFMRQAMREMLNEELVEVLKSAGLSFAGKAGALQKSVEVELPLVMAVPCGEPRDIDDLVREVGENEKVTLRGHLAEKATENSWVAVASGISMWNQEMPESIAHDDRLLMIPFDEWDKEVVAGTIILVKLRYRTGALKCTLKTYTGRKLKPNNPKVPGVEFGKDIEEATIWAICAGIEEKVFV